MPKAPTQVSGSEPADKIASVHPSRPDDSDTHAVSEARWVEDTPFYLDGILEILSTLSDEDKEAIHRAFQTGFIAHIA